VPFKSEHLPFSNVGAKIDVSAPGENILSTYPTEITYPESVNKQAASPYQIMSGTSMATPYVTGAIAILLSAHPEYGPEDVRKILQVSSDRILRQTNFNPQAGYGRINAYKMVNGSYSLPVMDITSPAMNDILDPVISSVVNITGQAQGNNFQGYQLFYAQGENPGNWNAITPYITKPVGLASSKQIYKASLLLYLAAFWVYGHKPPYGRHLLAKIGCYQFRWECLL